MTVRFLCACHRQLVLVDSDTSQQHWEQWMEKGGSLKQQTRYRESIAYFGCAFEVADYWLGKAPSGTMAALARFSHSSTLLVSAYALSGDRTLGEQVLGYTRARIGEQGLMPERASALERAEFFGAQPLAVH